MPATTTYSNYQDAPSQGAEASNGFSLHLAVDQPKAAEQERPPRPDLDHLAVLERRQLESDHFRGAACFWGIAACSAINSLLVLSGHEWGRYVIGLRVTEWIDEMGQSVSTGMQPENLASMIKVIATVMNLCFAGFIVLLGVLARNRQQWAYVAGMILYGADGVWLLTTDSSLALAVVFHAIMIFFIRRGRKALQHLKTLPPPEPADAAAADSAPAQPAA